MNITVPRALNVSTNPAGWLAALGAVFAAATMIYNAMNHHGVIDTSVIVAAIGAVGALLTRQVVTPVSDPKNGAGMPLVVAEGYRVSNPQKAALGIESPLLRKDDGPHLAPGEAQS